MEVYTLNCLEDNFSYVVHDKSTNKAICIDPVEPKKVMDKVAEIKADLVYAFCTHKHWDHSNGNQQIKDLNPNLKLISTPYETIPAVDITLKDQETIQIGQIKIQAFHTPCHTLGHEIFYMTFLANPEQPGIVFTGDTLFVGGCGRFFEGNGKDMNYSINKVIAKLPKNTAVYCGHEYTKNNFRFLTHIEPENQKIKAKILWIEEQLKNGKNTVPSTIGEELETNTFMRVSIPSVKQLITGSTEVDDDECMSKLRSLKDNF